MTLDGSVWESQNRFSLERQGWEPSIALTFRDHWNLLQSSVKCQTEEEFEDQKQNFISAINRKEIPEEKEWKPMI